MTGGSARIVVIDDSAYSRRTITRMLERIAGVEVIGYAGNGEEGIQKVIALKPDLVTLDLEMPGMDGFTLLRILTTRFAVPVLVISALNAADKVFKALELGALDFIVKPSANASTDLLLIHDDLAQKVQYIIERHVRHNIRPDRPQPDSNQLISAIRSCRQQAAGIELVAIGSSTGGPPALQQIFSSFSQQYPIAVVVSQHMPPGFTRAFAERLNRSSPFHVREAQDGDDVVPGQILIAPGGMNLTLETSDGRVTARTPAPSASDRYVPSVDVMLHSCAAVYGKRMMAVILTGMGNDGSRGIRTVHDNGGYVIAEAEESAVVFGMPREAAATGVVDSIVPLDQMCREILFRSGLL